MSLAVLGPAIGLGIGQGPGIGLDLAVSSGDWINPMIALLQALQAGLLKVLTWLGAASSSHGQAAWPWSWRLAGENLLIDNGQARRLGLSLVVTCVVLLGATVGLFVLRRGRWRQRGWILLTAALLLWMAPWPDAAVVLTGAYPTSLHQSPTGFSADAIVRGQSVYTRQCVDCHGADGSGQGPKAAAQPVWPPNFSGPLLWRRADGDLFWHIRHGMTDRHGVPTMAAFEDRLTDDETWAVIDYMKALGAGQALRAAGFWPQPIGVPDVTVHCIDQPPRALSTWRGQRLRIVASDDGEGSVLEDPRLITVWLQRAANPTARSQGDCVAESSSAWEALELIGGGTSLSGIQFIADRDGWLRARGEPGKADWSDDDLLCRTTTTSGTPIRKAGQDGLGSLIARIDAEPVRFVKGGIVH